MTEAPILQALHDREIQLVLRGEWLVELGDHLNGWPAKATISSFEEAEKKLLELAKTRPEREGGERQKELNLMTKRTLLRGRTMAV